MRLLPGTAIGLALVGAVLWSPRLAAPAQAQTATEFQAGLVCRGPGGTQGIADVTMGDPDLAAPVRFRLTCEVPRTRVSRVARTVMGDPDEIPYTVILRVRDPRGHESSCTFSGRGTPVVERCAMGDPELGLVGFGLRAQPVPEPD